jgi:hypothetical protein
MPRQAGSCRLSQTLGITRGRHAGPPPVPSRLLVRFGNVLNVTAYGIHIHPQMPVCSHLLPQAARLFAVHITLGLTAYAPESIISSYRNGTLHAALLRLLRTASATDDAHRASAPHSYRQGSTSHKFVSYTALSIGKLARPDHGHWARQGGDQSSGKVSELLHRFVERQC